MPSPPRGPSAEVRGWQPGHRRRRRAAKIELFDSIPIDPKCTHMMFGGDGEVFARTNRLIWGVAGALGVHIGGPRVP